MGSEREDRDRETKEVESLGKREQGRRGYTGEGICYMRKTEMREGERQTELEGGREEKEMGTERGRKRGRKRGRRGERGEKE